jgi:thymidine kinase
MDLTLILGPMKSGKSFNLISHFAPLKYTDIPFALYQSDRNVRDTHIASRNGLALEARKIKSLNDISDNEAAVIGIDELHMFDPDQLDVLVSLLHKGVKVVAAGLDLDYKGKMFDIIKKLLELGPKEVIYKRAVCEVCRQPQAVYSQVFSNAVPVIDGMPSVIPDDGSFTYQPVCHACFVRAV